MSSLWILAAQFCYALTSLFIKLSSADIGPLEAVFYRSVFACAILLTPALIEGKTLVSPFWKTHLFRACAGTTAQTIWILTVPLMPLATNMMFTNTTPIFMAIAIIGFCFLKRESIPWKIIAMVALGFAGVCIILQPEGDTPLIASLGALSCGFFSMIAYTCIRYLASKGEPTWRIILYYTTFGTVFGFAGCLMLEDGFAPITWTNLFFIFGIGLSALGAQYFNTRGYGKGNLLLNSTLQYSVVVFAQVFGFLVLGETLTILESFGIAVICAAAILATYFTRQWQKTVKNKPVWG